MDGFVVMEPTGAHKATSDDDLKTELRRFYYNTIDLVVGEMERRFSKRNSQLASALAALNPEADNFLDVKAVRHILDLSHLIVAISEFEVAKEFLMSKKQAMEGSWTIQNIISTRDRPIPIFFRADTDTDIFSSALADTPIPIFLSRFLLLFFFKEV